MLRTQLIFFGPLAIVVIGLAWIDARRCSRLTYVAASLAGFLACVGTLYLAIRVMTPGDGLLHLPTLAVAYAVPVLAVSTVMRTLIGFWSFAGKVIAGLTLAAIGGAAAPAFLLAAASTTQALHHVPIGAAETRLARGDFSPGRGSCRASGAEMPAATSSSPWIHCS